MPRTSVKLSFGSSKLGREELRGSALRTAATGWRVTPDNHSVSKVSNIEVSLTEGWKRDRGAGLGSPESESGDLRHFGRQMEIFSCPAEADCGEKPPARSQTRTPCKPVHPHLQRIHASYSSIILCLRSGDARLPVDRDGRGDMPRECVGGDCTETTIRWREACAAYCSRSPTIASAVRA